MYGDADFVLGWQVGVRFAAWVFCCFGVNMVFFTWQIVGAGLAEKKSRVWGIFPGPSADVRG